jgi:serine-type D-Ala-D-Ala carboxypeptidase (penicillin-binding protein 5/6)
MPATTARQALVIEISTQTKLHETSADIKVEPASTAKLMTFAVVADALKVGTIHLEDTFPVSEHAWRTGGAPSGAATMFAALKSRISVADLMKALAVQGANDAAIILAEGLSGNEETFAALMNKKAGELEMSDTHFVNPTGLPSPGQTTSVRDLVRLTSHLVQEPVDFVEMYRLREFTWNKITQRNRNPLAQADVGASIFVNAFSEANGYSYVGSFGKDGRTYVAALSGFVTEQDRLGEIRALAGWATTSLGYRRLFDSGNIAGEIQVQGGAVATVKVAVSTPVEIMTTGADLNARLAFDGPIIAPIEAGQTVGSIQVVSDGIIARDVPVVAAEAVAAGMLPDRAWQMLVALVRSWLG